MLPPVSAVKQDDHNSQLQSNRGRGRTPSHTLQLLTHKCIPALNFTPPPNTRPKLASFYPNCSPIAEIMLKGHFYPQDNLRAPKLTCFEHTASPKSSTSRTMQLLQHTIITLYPYSLCLHTYMPRVSSFPSQRDSMVCWNTTWEVYFPILQEGIQ